MSFLLKIENIAKSSKILISAESFFSRSKDRSRTHDQKLHTLDISSTAYLPHLVNVVCEGPQNVIKIQK